MMPVAKPLVAASALLFCVAWIACGQRAVPHTVTTPLAHRPTTPAACTPQAINGPCTAPNSTCMVASDCTAGLDGNCRMGLVGGSEACTCIYDDCLTDNDCATGTACSCDANRGGAGASGNPTSCVPSGCRLDADCGPGGFCSPSQRLGAQSRCGSPVTGFYCHTPDDECGNDSDCPGSASLAPICLYSLEVGHWVCSMVGPCAG